MCKCKKWFKNCAACPICSKDPNISFKSKKAMEDCECELCWCESSSRFCLLLDSPIFAPAAVAALPYVSSHPSIRPGELLRPLVYGYQKRRRVMPHRWILEAWLMLLLRRCALQQGLLTRL